MHPLQATLITAIIENMIIQAILAAAKGDITGQEYLTKIQDSKTHLAEILEKLEMKDNS